MHKVLNLVMLIGLPLAPVLAGEAPADLAVYRVVEQGLAPYFSRAWATPDWLRLDEGDDAGDYSLFDRRSGVLYNVDRESRQVLVFDPPRRTLDPPAGMELAQDEQPDPGMPKVGGLTPRRFQLRANGEDCGGMVAVDGLLPAVPAALGELHTRLADQHALAFDHGGTGDLSEFRDPCELADSLYAPARLYQQGLPLTTWNVRMARELMDYQQAVPVGDSLLRLPEGFGRLVISAPAEGDPAPRPVSDQDPVNK